MGRKIFISLTKQDSAIAVAIREAVRSLFGEFFEVHFSTSKETEGGIRSGEDWFQWIVQQVHECDFAMILVTPSSISKPWILWEAGAVAGAALATDGKSLRKVRPLVYQVHSDMIPSPIRDSKVQFRRGDSSEDFRGLLAEMLKDYSTELPAERLTDYGLRLAEVLTAYIAAVKKSLLEAPAVPTQDVIEEWRLRLDDLLQQNRASEVGILHDWMNVAFGRDSDKPSEPLDLRIHTRMGELYLKSRNYPRAIEQLGLALDKSPRDIYVLRTLGRTYLDAGDRDKSKEIMDRILGLDSDAFESNYECAAFAARWYRSGSNPQKAAEIYRAALDRNADSYYLANGLAETCLEAGDMGGAGSAYRRALGILARLKEPNVWTLATAANAQLFLGDDAALRLSLEALQRRAPSGDEMSSIERGLRLVASHVDGGVARLEPLLKMQT